MGERTKQHTVDFLFVLALLFVFAVSVVLTLGAGVSSYRNLLSDLERGQDAKTAVSYILTKFEYYDAAESISLSTENDAQSLVFRERIDGVYYVNELYFDGTYLRECFHEEGVTFDQQDGDPVLQLKDVKILQKSDREFEVCCVSMDGKAYSSTVYVRSGGYGI